MCTYCSNSNTMGMGEMALQTNERSRGVGVDVNVIWLHYYV